MQLVVAVSATVLSGLIWPGVMVVVPVALGVLYVVAAAVAFFDRKPFMWLAGILSLTVLALSTAAILASGFAVFQIESEMGDPPMVAVSPGGGYVELESIPESTLAEMRENYASVVRRQRAIVALLLLVSFGSCAVVIMHGFAWKWLIRPDRIPVG